jgi:two-component sensor histidine kinase
LSVANEVIRLDFFPHGYCMRWQPGLIGLHVVSDALIAIAYFCIPFGLFYFVRKRKDIPFHWMFIAFAAFILSCGATHVMGIVTLWHPVYWLDGIIKAATAMASIITAFYLFRLLPTVLQIPSRKELAQAEERTAESNRLNLRLEEQLVRERNLIDQMREQECRLQHTVVKLGKADEELRESLEERETLLKEMHHRVKNNLFVMSSLLRMQANSLDDNKAIAALQDSERRVLSMALIHERLYSGNSNMSAIDFDEYCQLLGNDLLAFYTEDPARISLRYQLAPIRLSVEQAIPCGLIMNELLTNAFKYAYPTEKKGEIFISLRGTPNNTVTLTVADQGVGFPAGFNWQTPKSLGLQIVQLLTNQIDGTIILRDVPGTAFELTFAVSVSAPAVQT